MHYHVMVGRIKLYVMLLNQYYYNGTLPIRFNEITKAIEDGNWIYEERTLEEGCIE